MLIKDLTPEAMLHRLASDGLLLRTGKFVSRISTKIESVAHGLSLLYPEFPLAADDDFADFHVRLAQPSGPRRWFHPQVLFYFDDASPFKPLPLAQAYPMLEWGLNWCVSSHCHQYVNIHAAVVEKAGRAVIFPAPPGSGKSTLCAGLVNRGWRLLSDELTLIDPLTAEVVPLPRPVSLKNASIDVIGRFAPDAVFGPTVRDTAKGTVAHMRPPPDSVTRAAESARPGWIVFPRFEAGQAACLQPFPKARAFMRLADNSFNYVLHGAAGFRALARIIDTSHCFEFVYGDLEEATELFAALQPPTS